MKSNKISTGNLKLKHYSWTKSCEIKHASQHISLLGNRRCGFYWCEERLMSNAIDLAQNLNL